MVISLMSKACVGINHGSANKSNHRAASHQRGFANEAKLCTALIGCLAQTNPEAATSE